MRSTPAMTCEGLDNQLSGAFLDAEIRLIEAVEDGGQPLDGFKEELFQLVARTSSAIDQKLLSNVGKQYIHVAAHNIRAIATFFLKQECGAKHVEERLMSQFGVILQDSSNQLTSSDSIRGSNKKEKRKTQSVDDSALAKFKPCCNYFLSHFGAPYPPNEVKYALATEIGVEVSSITMWFTNNRRRSRWNDVMRDYANNNKELMRQLVDDVLNPSAARPVPEAARKAVLDAKAFITRLSGDEISDVFREALAMEPMTPDELKAYTEERRMMQKRLADLKRTQEGREAHKARKAARAKAREEKATRKAARGVSGASITTFGASVKRKRMDENEIVEVGHRDRPMKRPNTTASGVQDAPVITSIPASSKRKRAEARGPDISAVVPNDERAAKRVRTSDTPPERKPRTRFVLDADGNPRRLRRKAQFRYRDATSTAIDTATPNITPTQVNDQQPSITPLVVRKRKHNHDTDPASAPCIRLPTTHKRRKAASEVRSRVTSSLHKSQSPQPNSKSRKKRNYERSASAPTTSAPRPEVPFLMPNVDNAIRQANRVASGPSALVGLGAYVEGDAMLPPLTEEELAMYIQPSTEEPIASGPATDDQITIDLDPNAFNNPPFALNLNSSNVESTLPPSDPSATFTDTNYDGIDALLQMITPQNQLEIPMIGVDDLMLDPLKLNAQLSQLQAEQAAQQQSFNVPFVPQPQCAPFFAPAPTPVYNPVPQVPGSFEDVLMNALMMPPQMPQQQMLAPAVTPFTPTISNSLSASSSFSSDFSGTSSFSVPSPPEEYVDPKPMSNGHPDSRVRSLSPAGSSGVSGAELYAEVERRKRELDDHLREYERKKAELGSIVTACAHSVIGSSDITA